MNFIRKGILNRYFTTFKRFLSKSEKRDGGRKGSKDRCGKEKAPPPPPPPPPRLKTFQIYRFNPDKKESSPTMQSYTIDLNHCRPMILDALFKIKTDLDSTLTFRRSCREGICGSCGMNVDGINRLACLHKIKPTGVTKIYPLPHMYVIKDLVVDFNKFLEQHSRIRPYLLRDMQKPIGTEQMLQSIKDRDKLDGYVECILCACCSTSCPEYWWHGHSKTPNDFLGPSALLNAYRWIIDSRDECTKKRLAALTNFYSVFRCHQINNCTNVCPKQLEPGKAISKLRLLLAGFKKKQEPDLNGSVPAYPEKGCDPKC